MLGRFCTCPWLVVCKNGPLAGKTLDQVWKDHPEIFGFPDGKVFPLLVKLLDANMDLSVQVHPDDDYAKLHENGDLGKTECWYIIDCKDDAELILGHHASTKEEFKQRIESGDWNGLLRRIKIKPGDFFYVPSGTLHALCKGTLVLKSSKTLIQHIAYTIMTAVMTRAKKNSSYRKSHGSHNDTAYR